ncbi:MAG: hypothetical protein AAF329_26615, partial [Cyanobacteria bacterium P01_A01_bin.17]
LGIAVIWMGTIVLSGSYPALYLSGQKVLNMIRGHRVFQVNAGFAPGGQHGLEIGFRVGTFNLTDGRLDPNEMALSLNAPNKVKFGENRMALMCDTEGSHT